MRKCLYYEKIRQILKSGEVSPDKDPCRQRCAKRNAFQILRAIFLQAVLLITANASWAGPLNDASDALMKLDGSTALKLAMPFAEQGDAHAQNIVGLVYSGGAGVPKDIEKSIHWLTLAEAQNLTAAKFTLGQIYSHDRDVLDHAKAVVHYRAAAKDGKLDAMVALAAEYWLGRGVTRDVVRAYVWYVLAATGNEPRMTAMQATDFRKAVVMNAKAVRTAMNEEDARDADAMLVLCQSSHLTNCD